MRLLVPDRLRADFLRLGAQRSASGWLVIPQGQRLGDMWALVDADWNRYEVRLFFLFLIIKVGILESARSEVTSFVQPVITKASNKVFFFHENLTNFGMATNRLGMT